LPSIKILTWGVSSFLIGIVFAKNLSQEDNTPPSFYTKDFTLPSSLVVTRF
jgi:hypothetical protein